MNEEKDHAEESENGGKQEESPEEETLGKVDRRRGVQAEP